MAENEVEEDMMSREDAVAYLKRKGKDVTKENIARCRREGRIWGDPRVSLSSW